MSRVAEGNVTWVASLPDGTYIVEHADGRLERKANQTDWARVDALTDKEIEEAVRNDPDAVPLDFDWSDAVFVEPPAKTPISIRLDNDVLDFFRKGGAGYQRRINQVLRSFMEQRRKRR